MELVRKRRRFVAAVLSQAALSSGRGVGQGTQARCRKPPPVSSSSGPGFHHDHRKLTLAGRAQAVKPASGRGLVHTLLLRFVGLVRAHAAMRQSTPS